MSLTRTFRNALIGLAALAAFGCAPPPGSGTSTSTTRSAAEQRTGDQAYPQIVKQFGGEYRDAQVQAYVRDIGRRLTAVSEQPNARWTFTVLDSPEINAFAAPGGHIFVTRGLIALAEDEAELASVVAHEIAHVTAGHNASRQRRQTTAGLGLLLGQIGLGVLGVDPSLANVLGQAGQTAAGGYVASYSRADELAADTLGIRYLARAGYDPAAAADFLRSLSAFSALRASIKGKSYDPNRVSFLASHPATGDRVREAERLGASAGAGQGERSERRHLATIDGIVWGDSPEQGYVRGNTFVHPTLRFTYSVPSGYSITNTQSAVVAEGRNGARFILDGGRDPGGDLRAYIDRQWLPAIAKSTRIGRPQRIESLRINGLDAAQTAVPAEIQGRPFEVLLTAIRHNGQVYRLTGIAPRGSSQLPAMARASDTFRAISASEAGRTRPARIDVVTARGGDSARSLGSRMQVEARPVDHFIVLNGLNRPGAGLRAGDQVKLVR